MRTAIVVFWVILFFASAPSYAAGTAIPPAPTAWVTDSAGFLSPQTKSALNARLQSYEQQTGHQVIVYVAPTTGGVPVEDWAVKAFQQWKIGRKGLDDGLALFVFTRDRTLRIEVGYGLEPKITDAAANRVLQETIEPLLRAGQNDAAVTTGVDRLIALIGAQDSGASGEAWMPSPGELIAIAIVVLVLLVLAARNPWLAMLVFRSIISSRGDGSSGRSFFGGGGRSGGGGASGRW